MSLSHSRSAMMASIAAMGLADHRMDEERRIRQQRIDLARASGVTIWVMEENVTSQLARTRTCSNCGATYGHDKDYCSADCCRVAKERERLARIAERAKRKSTGGSASGE
jgi:hypothetical protein